MTARRERSNGREAEGGCLARIFQGVKTPANVVELIRKRLKIAEDDYEKW
jgi:hypothetical protein